MELANDDDEEEGRLSKDLLTLTTSIRREHNVRILFDFPQRQNIYENIL